MRRARGPSIEGEVSRTAVSRFGPFRRIALLAGSLIVLACGDDSGTVGPAAPSPLPAATLRLPLRVHLLSSRLAPIDATLGAREAWELIGRVNEIWGQADILWEIEAITHELAQSEDQVEAVLLAGFPLSAGLIAAILPRDRLFAEGWDAFIVHDLASAGGSPGIYFLSLPAVVSSEVDPAGLGDPGRILAHELGHSLSLLHVACTAAGNLMAPGCNREDRTRLSAEQHEQARGQAKTRRPTKS